MSNILSQAEIDELLKALSSGEEPEPAQEAPSGNSPKVFDFRTANKFPKEQIRTLNIVFQAFGQGFANKLGAIMRTSCECEILSVEEMSFNEFNNSLPTPVVLAILEMPPMYGSLIVELTSDLAYVIINRLLGGSKGGEESAKQFTEIDLALLERVLRQTMPVFDDAWSKVITVRSKLDRLETSPQFAQVVSLNEPIAIVTLNLTIGGESGLVSVCIPHSAIEPVAKQLNTRMWFSSSTQDNRPVERKDELIASMLIHTPVSMTAYFADTPATVSDVMNLQVGDVIRLSQEITQPLMVKVQHIPKFRGTIGTSGGNLAIRIVDVIREENEDESVTG